MIVYVTQIMEALMHALFLIGLMAPLILFAVLSLAALIMVAVAVVEFPLVFLGVVGLGLGSHFLSALSKQQEVLCEQI
jgi:hypothetical protein